jgi:hypothetical protein
LSIVQGHGCGASDDAECLGKEEEEHDGDDGDGDDDPEVNDARPRRLEGGGAVCAGVDVAAPKIL